MWRSHQGVCNTRVAFHTDIQSSVGHVHVTGRGKLADKMAKFLLTFLMRGTPSSRRIAASISHCEGPFGKAEWTIYSSGQIGT